MVSSQKGQGEGVRKWQPVANGPVVSGNVDLNIVRQFVQRFRATGQTPPESDNSK